MKQLYYTSCKQGAGLQGRAGLQVRAASPGVTENTLRAATRYCYYYLPFGDEFRPDILSPQDAPIRFAFLQTQELGPIALQAVYFGVDPASGRPGNPFVHMVFEDVDKKLDALKVLASWRSPFWQADAKDSGKELEPVASLPGDGLADEALIEYTKHEGWSKKVAFLLNAFLQIDTVQQIFIVGEPSEIIGMLFAVARLIPPGMRRTLSFSTYERDVEGQVAKFVGTTWGKTAAVRDLPEYLYSGRAVSLNLKTGRSSDGVQDLSYTGFAIEALNQDTLSESVDPFLSLCEKSQVAEPRHLESVYKHIFAQTSDSLDEQDMEAVFRYPALKGHALRIDTFCTKLVAALEEESEHLAKFVDPLTSHISTDKEAATAFSNGLFAALLNRINSGGSKQLEVLLRQALPILPDANQLLVRVFRHFADQQRPPYQAMPLEKWLFLVQIWLDTRLVADDTSRMNRWLLSSDADGLGQLLNLVSDGDTQLRIFKLNLENGVRPKSEAWGALFVQLARDGDALSAVFEFGPAIISSEPPTAAIVRDAWQKLCDAVCSDKKSREDQGFLKDLFRIRLGVIGPDESSRAIFLEDHKLETVGKKLLRKSASSAESVGGFGFR